MKTALKRLLHIALISVAIFVFVIGYQMIWYNLRFSTPPEDAPETLSLVYRIYVAPLILLPDDVFQSTAMTVLVLSLYALILGAVAYLIIYISSRMRNHIRKNRTSEAS